jgi:enoyl-CoA hydratase/carnithine racemase
LGLWRDFVLRFSSTPVVSIAKIRGRTRGIGNEFVLACDMRFASRQSVLFSNPGIGVGLVPGGGALEWLPRLVGRSRALESVLSGDDFDADITEHYGWVNRRLDDHELDSFVDALVRRLTSFNREALGAVKAQVSRFGTTTAAELQSSNDMFFSALAWPGQRTRQARGCPLNTFRESVCIKQPYKCDGSTHCTVSVKSLSCFDAPVFPF